MIKRITYVRNFRCYQSWKQHRDAIDFQRLNVIYAPNGTGKSTFAELLSGVPDDPQWSHGMKAVIQPGDDLEETERVTDPEHWIWKNVRLFSAEYVRRNLRFDANDDEADTGTDAPALLHLGKPNIEEQQRRELAQQEMERLTPVLKDLEKEHGAVEREREKLCTDLGRRVNNTLRGTSDRFTQRFDKRNVKEALARTAPSWSELNRTFEQDQALMKTASWERIPLVDLDQPSLEELLSKVAAHLERTVASEVIDELRDRPDHESWVRQGMGLHGESDTCVFCEGEIGAGRRAQLDRHFDEGYTRLLTEVEAALERVRLLRGQAARFSSALPHRAEFFEDLREEYDTAAKEVEASITTFMTALDGIADVLEQKKTAMFTPLTLPSDLVPRRVDTGTVNEIIGDHNDRTRSLESDRARAADREFQRMLNDIRGPWERRGDKAEELAGKIQETSWRSAITPFFRSPGRGWTPTISFPTSTGTSAVCSSAPSSASNTTTSATRCYATDPRPAT